LDDKLAEARDELLDASEAAQKGEAAFSALPQLLGGDKPRRYFLAFQTPSEQRGTGGLIGFYGIIQATDGRIDLKRVAPIGTLPQPRGRVPAPTWFVNHYEDFSSFRQWQQVNESFNFPVVSDVLIRLYEERAGDRLDGVIAMDPIVLGSLTQGTGPIPSPELNTDISQENAKQVLLRDAYTIDEAVQARALKNLVSRFFEMLQSDDVDLDGLLEGLDESITNQHFKMYSQDPEAQDAIRRIEMSGWNEDPALQAVWHTSASPSKVDYFLHREISLDVELQEDGSAAVTETVELNNAATPHPGTELTGPGYAGDPEGLNRMFLNLMMPEGSKLRGFEIDGRKRAPLKAKEGDHPLVWEILEIPAGETATVVLRYDLAPQASTGFRVLLQPQAMVNPDRYSVRIRGAGADVAQEGVLDHEVSVPAR
jgi:hypothetical protein